MITLIFTAVIFLMSQFPFISASNEVNLHYYLGRWEWITEQGESYWRAPKNAVGMIDLRSIPQMSKAGGVPEGYGLFVYSSQVSGLTFYLGDDTKVLNVAQRRNIKTLLGLTKDITATKPLDILWELLNTHADPTGLTRWKPLMPERSGMLRLYLGGHSLVREERYDPIKHPLVLEQLKLGYRKIRQECLDNGSQDYRKILTSWQEKYKLDWKDFIPEDLPLETPLPHSTVITESFNKANAETLGPDLSWTELTGDWHVVSNAAQLQTTGTSDVARADSALATDDHYAQVDFTIGGTNNRLMTIIRKDSTTTLTFYFCFINTYSSVVRLYKVVDEGATQLGSEVSITLSLPDTVKTQANGSTITGFFNGSNLIEVTDTAITDNLYCGIRGYQAPSVTMTSVDNFEAGDIEAGVAFIPKVSIW